MTVSVGFLSFVSSALYSRSIMLVIDNLLCKIIVFDNFSSFSRSIICVYHHMRLPFRKVVVLYCFLLREILLGELCLFKDRTVLSSCNPQNSRHRRLVKKSRRSRTRFLVLEHQIILIPAFHHFFSFLETQLVLLAVRTNFVFPLFKSCTHSDYSFPKILYSPAEL